MKMAPNQAKLIEKPYEKLLAAKATIKEQAICFGC